MTYEGKIKDVQFYDKALTEKEIKKLYNKKDKRYILSTISDEGFGYAFIDYGDYKHIDDEEFHRLRKAFLNASNDLANYVGHNLHIKEDRLK